MPGAVTSGNYGDRVLKTIKITQEQYNLIASHKGDTMAEKLSDCLNSCKTRTKLTGKSKPKDPTNTAIIGRLFKEQYNKKFGHDYIGWGPKENGQIATWLKSLTIEQAKWIVNNYMAWNDPRAVKCGHTLGFMISNYIAMVTDFKRAKGKLKQLDTYKEQYNEEKINAVSERFADSRRSLQGLREVPNQTEGGVPEVSGDPFSEQGAFGLPSP